jgi:pimeloyl-ACP methyl ester carboxylesterase
MTPTILLIPGMSSIASVLYAPLVRELLKLGFADVLPLELPSVDATSRVKDLVPDPLTVDIQSIRAKIQALVDDGKEVVVAAHSYGGTPSLYASEGLWKHERQSKGLEGGVLKAVLISSSLSLPGTTIAGVRAEWAGKNMPELIAAQESSHVEIIDGVSTLPTRTIVLV